MIIAYANCQELKEKVSCEKYSRGNKATLTGKVRRT